MPWVLEINSNSGLSKTMWNLALQQLKTLYLHYHNAYDHQVWQGGYISRDAPTQSHMTF